MIRLILKLIWKLKKILIVFIILSIFGYYGYNYWHTQKLKETAIKQCQNLYKANVNSFSQQTGITGLNVDFKKEPEIHKTKNLYTLNWDKTIDVAGNTDSFKCQYNFATSKAIDRSTNFDRTN